MVNINEEFLRIPSVEKMVGFKKSKIWELVKIGKFPKPIKLDYGKITVFLRSEVSNWMQEQIISSKLKEERANKWQQQ